MRRPRPVGRALAAAITLLALLDLGALSAHSGPFAAISAPPGVRAAAAEAAKAVEALRGLKFRQTVPISTLSDDEFDRGLRQVPPRGNATGAIALFIALGLIDRGADLAASGRALTTEVTGLYDPSGHRIVLRAGLDLMALRRTLVHELTHALDDQHFGLARVGNTFVSDESLTTLRALFEGDAVWVERHGSQAPPDTGALATPPAVPPALLAYVAYPYEAGYRFVDSLRARGGTRLLNAAFVHPPTSSAQILDPALYQRSSESVEVHKPQPDGPVLDRGVFGELFVFLTLRSSIASVPALKASKAWRGGRYVVYEKAPQICIRARLAATTSGAPALVDGFMLWAARHPAATVTLNGTELDVANCEAIPTGNSS